MFTTRQRPARTGSQTRRRRAAVLLGAVLLGTTAALSLTSAAQAATSASLPPGSTVCTQQIRSSQGVAFYGGLVVAATGPTALWTVHASETETGPETTLLRLPSGEPTTTYVSWPGTLFYRLCVTNTTTKVAGLRVSFFPQGAGAVGGIGPATAVLGPSGSYCALETISTARLTGTSTVPVRWMARVDNLDGDRLRIEEFGTSTTVDRLLTPSPSFDENFTVCVVNTSTSTATISLDLVA